MAELPLLDELMCVDFPEDDCTVRCLAGRAAPLHISSALGVSTLASSLTLRSCSATMVCSWPGRPLEGAVTGISCTVSFDCRD